jgi:hypothetical protein
MRTSLRPVLLLPLLLAPLACGGSPAAPSPPAAQAITLRVADPDTDAAVVGTSLALRALVAAPGAPETAADDGVTWTSSNDRIATIDASGRLTGIAPGSVVVTATVKSTAATRAIDVVPNVAGTWTFDYVGTACDDEIDPGCSLGKPQPERGLAITLAQQGSHLTATWTAPYWATYLSPISGRVHMDASLDLVSENPCELRDYGGVGDTYKYRDWHMAPAADGSYAGQLTWEWDVLWGCAGTPRSVTTEVLSVPRFHR